MKGLIRGLSKLSFGRLLLLMATTFVFLSGGALAIWTLSITDTFTADVSGYTDFPLYYSVNFVSGNINVTDTNASRIYTAEMTNEDGPLTLDANITIVKTDVNDSCTQDWEDDCSYHFFMNDVEFDDALLVFVGGNSVNDIRVNQTCYAFSCPQSADITLLFEEY